MHYKEKGEKMDRKNKQKKKKKGSTEIAKK